MSSDLRFKFLKAVLGEDGARALTKASDRSPELQAVLLPRAILAWLGVSGRDNYEGHIPGVPNTYIQFTKSESGYSGSVAIGDEVYDFGPSSLIHLGATLAVAMDGDRTPIDPKLKDLDIRRLGKNIDTLVKARAAVSELKKMAIRDLAPGAPGGAGTFNYNHLLKPQHQKQGYTKVLAWDEPDDSQFSVTMYKGPLPIGSISATTSGKALSIADAEIKNPAHRGKGLGKVLYEAALAHGYHHHGLRQVEGSTHSTSASRTWESVAQTHGLKYRPRKVPHPECSSDEAGDYDNRVGPYSLSLKAEMPAGRGKEGPGPANRPAEPLAPDQAQAPDPTQNSKGPVVSLRPKAPKPPKTATTADTVVTGKGAVGKLPVKKSPDLKVTKAQAGRECDACGGKQFKGAEFTGCYCLRSLSKSVTVTALASGYNLEFDDNWDQDSVLTLIEMLGEE